MSKFTERRKLRKRVPVLSIPIPGRLGDGYGNVNVPGQANYVYCRVGSGIEIVYNDRVPAQHNLSVDLGRDNGGSEALGRFRVLGMRSKNPGGNGLNTNGTGYAPSRRYRFLAKGGGQDPLWVELRQYMPLRVGPFSGLTVQLQPGLVWNGTNLLAVGYQLIDLSAYQPITTGNAVYVSVSVDDTGLVVLTPGDEFILADMTTSALMLANVPAQPAGIVYFCGAVRLRTGQTKILEGRSNSDIVDPRSSGFIPSVFTSGGVMPETRIKGRAVGAGTGAVQDLTPLQAIKVLASEFGEYDDAAPRISLFDTPPDTTNFPLSGNQNALNVVQKDPSTPVRFNTWSWGNAPLWQGFRSQGTKVTPTVITAGNSLFGLVGNGFDGVDFWTGASMGFFATENWDDSPEKRGTEFRVNTTDDGGTTVVTMKFGIAGLNIPTGKTFNINGSPHAHAHDDTSGLQGGTSGEHYHLTAAKATVVNNTSGTNTGDQTVREMLTAARTYYVRTDGNDANNGLANTAGGAFRTIQKAINSAASIDSVIYDITISVAAGAYAESLLAAQGVGAGNIIIVGDESTPTNVSTNGLFSTNVTTVYHIRGFALTSGAGNGAIEAQYGSSINFQNISFGAAATHHLRAVNGGSVTATGNYTITGNATYHIDTITNGTVTVQNRTVTISGTRAFTTFCRNRIISSALLSGNTFASGSATGKRYDIQSNSVIYTNGAATTILPGNAVGTTATGGQYV